MDNSNIEVGKRVFDSRKHLGYTRERFSELAEISVQFLADIEKGRKSMTVATLRRVAAALNVTTDYIVNGSENFLDYERINAMLDSMSPRSRHQAERLLEVFVEAVTDGKNME